MFHPCIVIHHCLAPAPMTDCISHVGDDHSSSSLNVGGKVVGRKNRPDEEYMNEENKRQHPWFLHGLYHRRNNSMREKFDGLARCTHGGVQSPWSEREVFVEANLLASFKFAALYQRASRVLQPNFHFVETFSNENRGFMPCCSLRKRKQHQALFNQPCITITSAI